MSNHITYDFTGVKVLVTGGTSGIGHTIAMSFRAAGAAVMVTGTRAAASDYDTDLADLDYRSLEITDSVAVDSLTESLDALDVLINNAGATFPGGGDEWAPDTFAEALSLNLAGPMRLTSGCRKLLAASDLDGGASVVNIVSMASFRANTIVPGYSSAKAGLVALTRNMAAHWVGRGVRVNAVAPGVIDTPMTAPMAAFPEILDAELAHIPMGRLGTSAEVAAAVLFLSSSAASYITGTTLAVDGGYLLP